MAQAENKTQPGDADVEAFLQTVEHPVRRADAHALDAMFRALTGWRPRLWGGSIIGYGRYHYVYDTGREGDFLATGFSPRKANLSVYVMPGYQDYGSILARLGKHKMGKSCLHVTRLDQIDMEVLKELIAAGLADLSKRYEVTPG